MASEKEVKEFAVRVERICDFFISRISEEARDLGSDDFKVLQELKDEAADLQFGVGVTTAGIEGLSDYIKGVPPKE